MGKRRWLTVAGVTALAALAVGPAQAGPEPHIKLHPIDGGHWDAGAGLPDTRGNANQGLIRFIGDPNELAGPDTHPEVAAVTGLEGQPTSALEHVAFAVLGDQVGIVPCIKLAYTDPAGRPAEMMVTSRMMRRYEIAGHPDWHGYAYDGPWPPGTINAVELGIHIDFVAPPEPDRLVFDNIEVAVDPAGGVPLHEAPLHRSVAQRYERWRGTRAPSSDGASSTARIKSVELRPSQLVELLLAELRHNIATNVALVADVRRDLGAHRQ